MIEIRHKSAEEGLSELAGTTAALVFADPPYGDDNPWGWVPLAREVLADNGSLYVCCQWPNSHQYAQALKDCDFKVQNRITWKRTKGRGAKRNFKSVSEDIWFATKGNNYTFHVERVMDKKFVKATYKNTDGTPRGWERDEKGRAFRWTHPGNVWEYTVPFWNMPEYRKHPHQKPEALVERIVLASSEVGDLVVDPFVGSGTTAAVCKRLGRDFVGFEVDSKWVKVARERVE